MTKATACRHLVWVLGDQLSTDLALFDGFDPSQDVVAMAEVDAESRKVPVHKVRTAFFLSAMRHFRERLKEANKYRLHYSELTDAHNTHTLEGELERAIKALSPEKVIVMQPGEYGIAQNLRETLERLEQPYDWRDDNGFLCSVEEFKAHAKGRKQLRMEYFYRDMRKRYQLLMDGDKPEGGQWNYDHSNRGSFAKSGPETQPQIGHFEPDTITKEVLLLVAERFADNPGSLDTFDWPVTPEQAEATLEAFLKRGLPQFGQYQDAMWTQAPFLYHSRLSAALNVRLIQPLQVLEAVEAAYKLGRVSIEAAEGYIRQILGWREYIRGQYWLHMPDWLDWNFLEAEEPLPWLYWSGETRMNCLKEAVGQTLAYGYAHHIQRLMVTGLFALLLGARPKEIHAWYLAIYVDAVEWVELPNTLGMCQFVDGGGLASKPYVATGKYIQRMSNYCKGCAFDPAEATGLLPCPFTTFYWDFLLRHEEKLSHNQRMGLQLRNLSRLDSDKRQAIQEKAAEYRQALREGSL